ncbi:cationic amino acid transporter 2, vacuolar-like isoform X1 [Zingiber officinale]|uniref:cationic amino acid transporter 2, vacuolar-like isoform X1 n=1 Tax=Zingiber officinale TaxID=94328 RepID=UPI001C4D90F6|nr:cationic amino acid transporter 2, vacuolar-like isoform X1 [Zingiber officinale]
MMEFREGAAEERADSGVGFRFLTRRKQVDSNRTGGGHQLAKALSVPQLVVIGVGTTIGAGVYVLVGTAAREHSGPALTISFLIAGIAAALSAFCYAELSSRCPSAGSAYHYSYICVGEGVAWIVGWALILEYSIGGAAVARGISPNLALVFGGKDSLPSFLARVQIPGTDIVVDPCAASLVLIVTILLCLGIKESTFVQGIVTTLNVCVLLFVIIAGGYICFQTGWVGYSVTGGYFPYGVNGVLAGSATVFFAFIGFDSVASTAEEVKNPQRDLPLGIATALTICCSLYMMVSMVVVGLVPYFALDPDTPISSAFAKNDVHWAVYIITSGACLALCSALMGSMLPQPRILMAMSRDGLLPSFFSDVNEHTKVPVKSTIVTGVFASSLTFFMDVSQLAGMVSVGTLLAFTIVAVSILILRYVPPSEVPLPSSLRESIDSVSFCHNSQNNEENAAPSEITCSKHDQEDDDISEAISKESFDYPLIVKETSKENLNEEARRQKAAWSIAFVCAGVLILTISASYSFLPDSFLRYTACSASGLLLLAGLFALYWIGQDNARHSFGHAGGFICPFVPFLPVCCILVNTYLLVNLSAGTWLRVSVWLLLGIVVYLFYGRTRSSLTGVVYVPGAHVDEIFKASEFVA